MYILQVCVCRGGRETGVETLNTQWSVPQTTRVENTRCQDVTTFIQSPPPIAPVTVKSVLQMVGIDTE